MAEKIVTEFGVDAESDGAVTFANFDLNRLKSLALARVKLTCFQQEINTALTNITMPLPSTAQRVMIKLRQFAKARQCQNKCL